MFSLFILVLLDPRSGLAYRLGSAVLDHGLVSKVQLLPCWGWAQLLMRTPEEELIMEQSLLLPLIPGRGMATSCVGCSPYTLEKRSTSWQVLDAGTLSFPISGAVERQRQRQQLPTFDSAWLQTNLAISLLVPTLYSLGYHSHHWQKHSDSPGPPCTKSYYQADDLVVILLHLSAVDLLSCILLSL